MRNRKIAIEGFAILQTGYLVAILCYRRIFSPHRIDDIRLVVKMASASSGSQLASLPKNQCLFLGRRFFLHCHALLVYIRNIY